MNDESFGHGLVAYYAWIVAHALVNVFCKKMVIPVRVADFILAITHEISCNIEELIVSELL